MIKGRIKAFRPEIEALGVQLNILGHGSHTPHDESAIRHIKSKTRTVLHSLSFPLASKVAVALISFVVQITTKVISATATFEARENERLWRTVRVLLLICRIADSSCGV